MDIELESLTGSPQGSDSDACGGETVSNTEDYNSSGPRGTAAALKALGALAASHRRELESLFALYLRQQRHVFEACASSSTCSYNHGGNSCFEEHTAQRDKITSSHGSIPDWNDSPSTAGRVLSNAKIDAGETMAEARQLELPPIVEAGRVAVAWAEPLNPRLEPSSNRSGTSEELPSTQMPSNSFQTTIRYVLESRRQKIQRTDVERGTLQRLIRSCWGSRPRIE